MEPLSNLLSKNLVFVHGKGGVGKTVVSQAIALCLAKKAKVLWVTIEDPTKPSGKPIQMGPNLWHLNCDFQTAFEEYAEMKIGFAPLTRIFLQNKLMRYMAKAAPGIHELVVLGKIWFERNHYSHVVVDMPSTGYGLAMFQSTENFAKLFRGGPVHRDAEAMLETFRDPQLSGNLVLALPEEMPLQEALELNDYLSELFPKNPAGFIVNRLFPRLRSVSLPQISESTLDDSNPLASSIEDYIAKRILLENYNLRLWREKKISFGELEFIPPPQTDAFRVIPEQLAVQIQSKAIL